MLHLAVLFPTQPGGNLTRFFAGRGGGEPKARSVEPSYRL